MPVVLTLSDGRTVVLDAADISVIADKPDDVEAPGNTVVTARDVTYRVTESVEEVVEAVKKVARGE